MSFVMTVLLFFLLFVSLVFTSVWCAVQCIFQHKMHVRFFPVDTVVAAAAAASSLQLFNETIFVPNKTKMTNWKRKKILKTWKRMCWLALSVTFIY